MSTLSATNLKNASSGSNNIVLGTDGSVTVTTIQGIIKQGTAVASTSGTAIDFTNIPSWVKRITVMLNKVSTSSTSGINIQIGTSAGVDTTANYGTSTFGAFSNTSFTATGTQVDTGFSFAQAPASGAFIASGVATLTFFGSNTWLCVVSSGDLTTARHWTSQGVKALSGTLDRVRITSGNGTDTFDAGSINILYEG